MKSKTVPVRVIERAKGGSVVLVEWITGEQVQRGYLQESDVQDGSVEKDVLDLSTPYGLPWETIIKSNVTPAMIASKLRRAGIWTHDDLRRNQSKALAALQAAYGIDLANLNQAASVFKKE